MKNRKKIVISIMIDKDKWEKAKKKAQDLGISASAFVRQSVYQNLKKGGENVRSVS
jgi:hypothetical protein